MTPIECLEIWGLSVDKYLYDGYMCLNLKFNKDIFGVAETTETFVIMCPDPAMKGEASIVVGTNTSTVKRLFHSCKTHRGGNFLNNF